MLTVRDILQLPILSSGKVVAGTRGLSRVVEHVSVMEVDLTKWCSPIEACFSPPVLLVSVVSYGFQSSLRSFSSTGQ